MAQQNKGKGRSRRSGSGSTKGQNTLQHPGAVLAQILEDTPTALAAKWFSLSEAELLAVLEVRFSTSACTSFPASDVSVFSSPFLGSERSRFIAGLGQLFMTSCVSVV